MRRAAEKDYVTGLSQIGIRNVSSTAKDGYEAARSMGSDMMDLVEVAPDYDHAGSTSTLAAQLLLNFIGRVLHHR